MVFRLTVLTAAQILAFVGALIYYLWRIVNALEQIGGSPSSSLAKLRFGIRAIEQESGHLGPQVTQLNAGFVALVGKLSAVDQQLAAVADVLSASKEAAQ